MTLFETGEVALARSAARSNVDEERMFLSGAELVWRANIAGKPPKFDTVIAHTASRVLLALCQAVIYRETEIHDLTKLLSETNLPTGPAHSDDPSAHYSVDLLFRFLPQVIQRAKRISESDALIPLMLDVLRPWPLSSIGVRELCPPVSCPSLQPILCNKSLWRMYVDRIISKQDIERLQHSEARAAVASAIGPFGWLSPEMNKIVNGETTAMTSHKSSSDEETSGVMIE